MLIEYRAQLAAMVHATYRDNLTKLVGIVAGASSVISAFVSAAAWAAQHYKG